MANPSNTDSSSIHPVGRDAAVITGVFQTDNHFGQKILKNLIDEIVELKNAAIASSNVTPELAAIRPSWIRVFETGCGDLIRNCKPNEQVAIVVAALDRLQRETSEGWFVSTIYRQVLTSLLRKKLPYRAEDLSQLLNVLVRDAPVHMLSQVPRMAVLGHVERYVAKHGAKREFRNALLALKKTFHTEAYDAHCRKVGERVENLLSYYGIAKHQTASSATVKSSDFLATLETGEAWTTALCQELRSQSEDAQKRWIPFLLHCGQATKSKPTRKWLRTAAELVVALNEQEFVATLQSVLGAVGLPGKPERFVMGSHSGFHDETQVHATHIDTLRGLVWATSGLDAGPLISSLGDAASMCFEKIRGIGPRCPKIGNACLVALSAIASPEAVAQLGRLKARTKHVSTRKQIDRAYETAAANAGLTREDLIELGVPKFGLTEVGGFQQVFGDSHVDVNLKSNGKSLQSWMNCNGKRQKSIPAKVKSEFADELKVFKKKLKEIEKLMPSIRQRVESIFRTERSWSVGDFLERYHDHPIVGTFARTLIWNLDFEGKTVAAFWHDGVFADVEDKAIENWADAKSVSLWHPMDAEADEVLAWRDWLMDKQVTQPFKQAHREVYLLTDAEVKTSSYSNRFAAHILRQHQLNALCQLRGWRYGLQGQWDSWNSPTLDLPHYNLSVEFHVEPMEDGEVTAHFVYTQLATDQVRFYRQTDEGRSAIALAEVDRRLFSEVMRDVDLFVGVTSVGNDPQWHDRGDQELNDYWHNFSFGELNESAATRKATLESIVPNLKIADQCQFDGNFLRVTGQLRTYKIHLGSGNILMEPNDQYLCIVRGGSGKASGGNVFLPFEGDATLSLILSKAFLLAADSKIKDSTILSQIKR